MRWIECILILLFVVSGSNAQFGEIASLATSLLGGALGNGAGIGALAGAGAAGAGAAGAAGQAGGALAQIGQLYQLAQGALQLTGTGVGVLNQASEGNWFPAVLEQTAKNSQALMKQGGGNGLNLGALGPAPGKSSGGGLGPEFGTSFPAPNIDDYDENAEIPGVTEKKTPKAPDGLVDIEDEDYELETTTEISGVSETSTTTPTTTITPNEEEEEDIAPTTTSPPPRQIRIQLPDKDGKLIAKEESDYEDLIKQASGKETNSIPTIDAESNIELEKNIIATHGTKTQPIVPKLDKLVEVLQKSKLSKEEIDEIVSQVEGNRHIEKPAKYDFNAAVQNIPDKKNLIRQKITDASRIISKNIENQSKDLAVSKNVDEYNSGANIKPRSIPTSTATHAILAPEQTSTQNGKLIEQNKQPVNNFPTSQNQFQPQPQQVAQQTYYTQAPYYGLQYYHNWGQNQNNQQYGLPQQSQSSQQIQQTYQQQQFQQQLGRPAPYVFQQTQYPQQVLSPQQVQQLHLPQTPVHQPQYYTQQQRQYPSFPYQATQQPQNYQPVAHPTGAAATNQAAPPKFVSATVKGPISSQQVVYRQGNAQPTAAPQRPANTNPNSNQVVHYYNDGKEVIQQIIPRNIATNGNLPLRGPFQSQSSATPNPVEYQRIQRALQQAYYQPTTKKLTAAEGQAVVSQPSAPVRPRFYESTVTATGHSQVHAIRTYQATKSARVTPLTVRPATRSFGKVRSSRKRYSGHVLPVPTIDHRSILEKRTTANPRNIRLP